MSRVLVIHDHPIVLQGVRQLLEDAGVNQITQALTLAEGSAQGQARCAHAARADARRDPTSALGDGEGSPRLIAIFVNSGGAQFREYFVLAQPDMIRDYAQVTSVKIQ
jgi:CheY-like chemotaxis protein